MTYREALDYIHSVVWKGSRPGLSRITELLHALGDPQEKLHFVHVAGTNGKGSFCAMTEAILRHAGYRTGLFVSPFIKDFNERICYCGKPISKEDLARVTAQVRPAADKMEDAPTEFELITAIGLVYFLEKGCDVVVLETGMGGRLDSTNIIPPPCLTVITGIALDHTAYLGDTVEQIAAEKAGIIKRGTPVLFGGRDAAARGVIEERARELGIPFVATADTELVVTRRDLSGTVIDYGEWRGVSVPLLGTYQAENLANVLAALPLLRGAGLHIPESAVREGLSHVRWRGRFEKLCEQPLILSDGAHNPQGVVAARDSIKAYFGEQKLLLITGVMADKDYNGMIKTLHDVVDTAFTVTPDNPRALPAAELAAAYDAAGIPAHAFDTVEGAVAAALSLARERGVPLISLGSLYLYAEFTAALEAAGVISPEMG